MASLPAFPQLGFSPCLKRRAPFLVKASHGENVTMDAPSEVVGRRQTLAVGTLAASISLLASAPVSFAAESLKGFQPVLDRTDGYSFFYPFGWQEVVVKGQDKVFKDVIEPLENVSINLFPTSRQDIKELGPPQEVVDALIKKVLAPTSQTTKLIDAAEKVKIRNNMSMEPCHRDAAFDSDPRLPYEKLYWKWRLDKNDPFNHVVDGRSYYTFEFVAQAPNYTRHALGSIAIANGKFYTLTTGSNERRWDKVKDKLHTVVDSFKVFSL